MAKVSVIVPVYNVEDYLARCLDSLVNQTLDDIEIVVVNDGSLDGSQKIIDEYVELYPQKIRAFYKENGGLSDARNYGFARATGEYIGFVDSDDYVEKNMYSLLYDKAIKGKCDMVDSAYFIETDSSKKLTGILPQDIKKEKYIEKFTVCFCTKLVHRTLIEKVGDIPKIWHEDVAYMPVIASYAKKIGFVNKGLYHYYTRESSISNSFFDNKVLDMVKAVDFALAKCNPRYKEEVVVLFLKLLDRNVLYRWVYSGDFIKKIREIKDFVYMSSMDERYPALVNGFQKYWNLTEGEIPSTIFVNGFDFNWDEEKIDKLKEASFREGGQVVVLDTNNCDVSNSVVVKCYERGEYDTVATYFAMKKIVEEGGIYLSNNMEVDVPFNALLQYDAFFAYSGISLLSDEIFGGKKDNVVLKKVLAGVEGLLENEERIDLAELITDYLRKIYGIKLDNCTRLFEDNLALLRIEAVYCYPEALGTNGKNAMRFCHYKGMGNGNDAVMLPASVFRYYLEKGMECFSLASRKDQLVRENNNLKKRISEFQNSTVWKMTKPLRKVVDKIKVAKRKVIPELKEEYKKLYKDRKQLEKKYSNAKQLLDNYSKKDCIADYHEVVAFANELEKKGIATNCPLFTTDPGSYYGIQTDMMMYAGIDPRKEKIKDYSLIEHGAHFQNIAPFGGEGKRRYTGYITLGDFRKTFVQNKYALPVYAVGPYIAYADQYYSESQLEQMKKEWGKVLLIFYAHNHEWLYKEYNNDAFFSFVKRQKENFDTIVLSCYWADLNSEYVKVFEEMGVKIVTSGFRSDNNFMRRQKSLLTLADSVLTNDIGSHVGYAVYMNKPVTFFKTEVTEVESKERLTDKASWLIEKNKEEIANCFRMEDGDLNKEISQEQREICLPYFGFNYVRTKEEMKAIFTLAHEIYDNSEKRVGSYNNSINDIMKKLSKSKNAEDIIKLKMLREAMGK